MALESQGPDRANVPTMIRPVRTAWIICAAFCTTMLHISAGLAQPPAPITSSGLGTQVTLSPTQPSGKVQYDITGGTRAGTNLFHSFGDFNVPNNNIANFLNDAGLATANILGRVTGENLSNVFGTIQTTGFGSANLFLMNPSGIIFGPNASLNVGGSVTFTTADYLRFADNGRFNAIPNATTDALLSTAPVAAYGFLGSNPGTITVQGSHLSVKDETGISLVGGNITVQSSTLDNGTVQPARISAPGGQINLASAASGGEIEAQTLAYGQNINGESFGEFGTLHVSETSVIDASGNGGGTVIIRGGRFLMDDSRIMANTTGPATGQLGGPTGKGIDIQIAQDLTVQNKAALITNVGPSVVVGSGGIRISADQITIRGVPASKENFFNKPFTGIQSDTQGAGNAGDIILRSTGDIKIVGVVNLDSFTFASGDSANIELTSMHGNIQMTEGGREAQGSSQTMDKSSGNAGTLTASALEGDIELNGASLFTLTSGSGKAGHVTVEAINLRMKASLLSSFSSGPGEDQPGDVRVILTGNLEMTSDPSLVLPFRSPPDSVIVTASINKAPAADITIEAKDIVLTQASSISSDSFASGPAGNLKIVTDTLRITDGAQFSSGSRKAPNRGSLPQNVVPVGPGGDITIEALGPAGSVLVDGVGSGIFTDAQVAGVAGTIDLSARTLAIQNGGAISAETTGTDPRATGGSIIVSAIDQVKMTGGASITASSTGPANAGSIKINAGQELDVRNSSITTEASQAKAGNIEIRAIDLVRLVNGEISTSVHSGAGSGGNITIDPNAVILQNNSTIFAQAMQGRGGNIMITTPLFLADSTSLVNADSRFGLSGTVTIQSPTSNLSGTVKQLTSKPSETQALLQNRCAALAGGEQSTFIVAGRDTLPSQPGAWLSSPISMDHWIKEDSEHTARLMVNNIGMNEIPAGVHLAGPDVLSLRRLTPPGFLVRTLAIGPTGCPS